MGIYTKSDNKRVFGLDLLRSIAIIFVLFSHTFQFILPQKYLHTTTYYFGFFGVELFFVLSGFLIGGILIKNFYEKDEFDLGSAKIFWLRRWFRTFPNYYIVFIISIFIEYFVQHRSVLSESGFFSHIFFLQSLFYHQEFFTVAWSLVIEEWFYLLFPILLVFISKFFLGSKSQKILVSTCVFIGGCLVLRFLNFEYTKEWDGFFRKAPLLRLDSIAIGVLFAYIKNEFKYLWVNKNKFFLSLSLIGISATSFCLLNNLLTNNTNGLFIKTLFFSLVSVSVGFLLPYFDNLKYVNNKNFKNIITYISITSYSAYLIHSILIVLLGSIVFVAQHKILYFILIWLTTMFTAHFMYKYFEKPIMDLRDKF